MNEKTGKTLYRIKNPKVGDENPLIIGPDERRRGYRVGKIYLEPDLEDRKKYPDWFEELKDAETPPDCSGTTLENLAERCDALIEWLKGEVASKLDWKVEVHPTGDYEIHRSGQPTFVKNRPVSVGEELIRPRIRQLVEALLISPSHGERVEKLRGQVKRLDSMRRAIELVEQLRAKAS